MRIKLIKAVMGVFTVLMSYKIIKFIWYFNKAIIYIIGLLFVGVNWSDYRIISEIKLIYDSLVLYLLSFLPDNDVTDEMSNSTKNDIKEIIYKDHTNIDNRVDDDYVYVLADRLPEVKSIRNELKETIITDGGDNSWSLYDVITSPWLIFVVAAAVIVSGVFVVYHYDLTMNQVTEYTWTHIKSGFVATVLFIGRVIKWVNGWGNNPRPPINPGNPDLPINPALNLDSSSSGSITPKSAISIKNNSNVFTDIKGKGPMGEMTTEARQKDFDILFPRDVDTGMNIGPAEISVKDMLDTIDHDNPLSVRLFQDNAEAIAEAESILNKNKGVEITPEIVHLNRVTLRRLRDIYKHFPMKPWNSPLSSGSSTPTASSSKINSEGLSLKGFDLDD